MSGSTEPALLARAEWGGETHCIWLYRDRIVATVEWWRRRGAMGVCVGRTNRVSVRRK